MRAAKLSQYLQKRLAYWQERLSLQVWQLKLKLVSKLEDEDGDPVYGYIKWRDLAHEARIQLVKKDSETQVERKRTQMEDSLVHELLHLLRTQQNRTIHRMLSYLAPSLREELGTQYEEEEERMIGILVRALRGE